MANEGALLITLILGTEGYISWQGGREDSCYSVCLSSDHVNRVYERYLKNLSKSRFLVSVTLQQ